MTAWLEIRPIDAAAAASSRREAETAAWRAIVAERMGDDAAIAYAPNGAPVLENKPGYIGVSHTKGWVAVAYSPDHPVAVDIELKTRKISPAAAARYSIRSVADWCALEAAYKYASVVDPTAIPVVDPPALFAAAPPVRFHPHPQLVVATVGI
jgi:phosphopantetheinyl transferase